MDEGKGIKAFNENIHRVFRGFKILDVNTETSIEAIDSLARVEICQAAEECLDIELSYEEVSKLRTVGELEALLQAKGGPPAC